MNETENKPKRKATRRIKKFDFSNEKATVSLVSEDVGGPANGILTLITKSKKNVSEEFLKKASQVTVTLEITEYLRRFFGIWWEDAEVLARSLGFVTAEMEAEAEDTPDWYEKQIEEKLKSIKVMKSLHESENIEKAVLELSEEDYLQVLQDQELIEKAIAKIDSLKNSTEIVDSSLKNSTANAEDNSTNNVDVENGEEKSSVVKNKNKENSMTEKVEVVEKAQFEAIQKQLEDQKVELEKALDLVKQFEAEKKEAIAKARKEQISKACGKHAEVIFKAVGECKEEDFVAVVKALTEMNELIEKSALFQEQGASVSDVEDNQESPIAKALQARLAKQQKQ